MGRLKAPGWQKSNCNACDWLTGVRALDMFIRDVIIASFPEICKDKAQLRQQLALLNQNKDSSMKRVMITGHQQAKLVDTPNADQPIDADRVRGHSLVTLVSSGTELNHAFLSQENFPKGVGYAAVFEIDEVGVEVNNFEVGDVVFAAGGHCERHEALAAQCVKLPAGLAPEVAVFARLMGVSMTTLNNAAAHPPAKALVTGLGPVGYLAAQVFQRCGYDVVAADPVESRCELARAAGIRDVRSNISGDAADDLKGRISLHLECSGYERAVLDGCRLIRRKGECVLIGVPWSRRADIQSFDVLHAVFHNYVNLRSGWEWEIPRTEEMYRLHSIIENFQAAVRWLAEGSIKVDGLASLHSPADCQQVYASLLDQSMKTPAAIFDWRLL